MVLLDGSKMNKSPEAAIYYVPEAYSVAGEKLMGRNAAGHSFLDSYFQYGQCETFWAYVRTNQDFEKFLALGSEQGVEKKIKGFAATNLQAAEAPGVIYYPGPDIAELATHRTQFGASKWSLCGVTHTTSSARAMDSVASWLTASIQSWDAIICTSPAVKKNVEVILENELGRLKKRLGITKHALPQLPVIPLGIRTEQFDFSETQKATARRALQLNAGSIVVLYVGRLSFHAKAHPLAMYQALEIAAGKTGKEIVLIECGWFANDYARKAFEDAATKTCPSVKVIRLDGRDSDSRLQAWASADIFCSLADNIQETFGITPIEAMAAGLACVVTDWDGYKDSVGRDCGFRVPTSLPTSGLGQDLATRHAIGIDNYDFYCGHTCLFAGVDIEIAANCFIDLVDNRDLRERMGAAGKRRAKSLYDWSVIIPQYEDLWSDLAKRREAVSDLPSEPSPTRLDPFLAFSHYATNVVGAESKVELSCDSREVAFERLDTLLNLEMVSFGKNILPSIETLQEVITIISQKNGSLGALFSGRDQQQQLLMIRTVSFLHKLGLMRLSNTEG